MSGRIDHQRRAGMAFTLKITVIDAIIGAVNGDPFLIGAQAGWIIIDDRRIGQATVVRRMAGAVAKLDRRA